MGEGNDTHLSVQSKRKKKERERKQKQNKNKPKKPEPTHKGFLIRAMTEFAKAKPNVRRS